MAKKNKPKKSVKNQKKTSPKKAISMSRAVAKKSEARKDKRGLLTILVAILVIIVLIFLVRRIAQKRYAERTLNPSGSQSQEKPKHDIDAEAILAFYNQQSDAENAIKDIDFEKLAFEKNVPILMYHYIEAENPTQSTLRRDLTVTPENLDFQMKWLYDNGFTTLTLSRFFKMVYENSPIPEKAVLLTFDDGYKDFFTDAAPILNRYNQKATVFIISGNIGYPAYMDWDQVKILSEQGFEFGSHTIDHPNLKTLKDDKLKEEVVQSKEKIESELGVPVNFFCYPGGFFDKRVEDAVRAAGYKGAFTTINGYRVSNKNMFEMTRFRITHTMGIESFAWTLNSAYK